jgi:hypothetical protein
MKGDRKNCETEFDVDWDQVTAVDVIEHSNKELAEWTKNVRA